MSGSDYRKTFELNLSLLKETNHQSVKQIHKSNIKKITCFTALYWNGGGCMSSRLDVNPELKSLLAIRTDLFVYAENLIYSKSKLKSQINPPGYGAFHLMANRKLGQRGISVFFLEKHRHIVSKSLVSKKYDIIWVELVNNTNSAVFCFFYAPGGNRTLTARVGFYDELREGYKKFQHRTKVFFVGDANARLGSFSQDLDINGQLISNINNHFF